jgi:hypothetical protein
MFNGMQLGEMVMPCVMLFTIDGIVYDFFKAVREFLVINVGCN